MKEKKKERETEEPIFSHSLKNDYVIKTINKPNNCYNCFITCVRCSEALIKNQSSLTCRTSICSLPTDRERGDGGSSSRSSSPRPRVAPPYSHSGGYLPRSLLPTGADHHAKAVGTGLCDMIYVYDLGSKDGHRSGGVRLAERVTLIVDNTRFVVDPAIFTAQPNTMLGRWVVAHNLLGPDKLEDFLCFPH